jgi:hypothetical protein
VIVTAHQPNFLPWLGFFDKMRHSDVLVLLDTVQFTKRGFQNRARIKSSDGPRWLTVPVVTKGRYDQRTLDVEIDESQAWRQVHRRTFDSVLARAPYRDALLECVDPVYADEGLHRLTPFTTALIERVAHRFGITTRIVHASDLDVDASSTELMIGVTRAVGGDTYLSGPSGRGYLDPGSFLAHGLELRYHSDRAEPYPQRVGEFVPGLSCADYIANVGFEQWAVPTPADLTAP